MSVECGLRSHLRFLIKLKNKLNARLKLLQIEVNSNLNENSQFNVITLDETCQGPFSLLFIGLTVSSIAIIFELFKHKYKNVKLF